MPATLRIDHQFWVQWILCNCLVYGLGAGIPILLTEVQSTPNYASNIGYAVILTELWVGVTQWLMLRQKFAIPAKWIWLSFVASVVSFQPYIHAAGQFSPSRAIPLLCLYPIFISLSQWYVLRQRFQPAWSWVPTSCFGLIFGGLLGFFLGTYIHVWWNITFGLSALVGGLACGLVYGIITAFDLRHITQQKYTSPKPSEPASKYDNPPNHKTWVDSVIISLPLLVIMGGWWWLLPPVPSTELPSIVKLFIFLGIFYLYQYFAIFIHELGHYLFAWANGSKLYRFAIGRLILIQTDQGLKLRRCRRQLAGGFAEPIPTSLHRLDRQLFLLIMGGPAASFLLFCFSTLPLLSPTLIRHSLIVWCLTFMSGISLHMAIFNTIPIKIGYFSTDGRRMLDLAKKNIPGQRFLADYQFNAYLLQGIRPKDIDPDLKTRLLALPENSMDHISGLIMAYYMALDQGQIQQAGDYLDQALKINAYYPELFRASLLLEGAYYEAHIRQHPDAANQWLDQIQEKILIAPSTLLRTEAAIHLAEGDKISAQTKAEDSLAILQKPQFLPGFTVFEQDRLQMLLQDLATS